MSACQVHCTLPFTNSSHVVPGRGEAGGLHKAGERFESAASTPREGVLMALPLHHDYVRYE